MATTTKTGGTTRKPAARKKTTARKPAAKKTEAPKVEVTEVEAPTPEVPVHEFTEEERQSLLTAYTSLKGAGLPVPDDIAGPVEHWIKLEEQRRAAEQAERDAIQERVEEENAAGPWYVRNGYSGAPLSLRLDRHTERRRIELKPRGQAGDMHPLEEGDLTDPVIVRNIQIGVCEVIPAGEAKRIAEQQTHNMQPRVHTPTAILRNAEGKPYEEGAVKMEVSYDAQGVTVGVVDPEQMQGKYDDRTVANSQLGGIARTDTEGNVVPQKRSVASQFIPTGGNPHIIENGPVQTGSVPQLDIAKAKIADDLARRAGNANPLAGMRVTVNPTQKA